MLHEQITDEEAEWYADRVEETRTGRIIVKASCVRKFRKLHDDELSTNERIRDAVLVALQLRNFV